MKNLARTLSTWQRFAPFKVALQGQHEKWIPKLHESLSLLTLYIRRDIKELIKVFILLPGNHSESELLRRCPSDLVAIRESHPCRDWKSMKIDCRISF